MDAEQIADAVVAKLKTGHHALWLDPETHSQQHEFIQALIAERAEKLARRKAIQDRIAGSLILSGVLAILTLIGAGALDYFREHVK